MPHDICEFFEAYCAAFNRLDGEAVARLYHVPSGIASERGYTHWSCFELIRDNMIALCQLYRDNGYQSARFEPIAHILQGRSHAVVDLLWTIERTNDRESWRFHTGYNLRRSDEGWRVLLCTAYEEKRLNA